MIIERRNQRRATASLLAAFLLILWGSSVAAATERGDGEAVIAGCIRRASGGRDWLQKTLWGLRDQEGGWIGAEVRNRDGSYDLGPLQINSWWVARIAGVTGRSVASVRWWLIHDACFNVNSARWIFLSGLAVTRDYWKAIGLYHSPKSSRQRRYTASVIRQLQRRYGATAFARSGDSR